MKKYEQPLMIVAVVFSVIMAVLGWYTVARAGFGPAIILGAVGTLAVAATVWGKRKESLFWTGGGALGAGLLFPTELGIVPMIIGFVLFSLLISLALFNDLFDGKE